MFRAEVTPFLTQDHRDVADVPQTQAFAVYPEGFPAVSTWETGNARPLIILARHMRDQVFEGLALDRFPRPGNCKHKTPTPGGVVGIALHDHLHILLGAIGRIAFDDNPLWPTRAGQSAAPSHGTAHFPSGTPDGFSPVSGERPLADDTHPSWQSTRRNGCRKTTADAHFSALFGPRDSACPAWV